MNDRFAAQGSSSRPPAGRRAAGRGAWEFLQRPSVTVLCAVVFGASWWVVPHDLLCRGVTAPEGVSWDPLLPEFVIVENGVARFANPGVRSEGDLWSYAATHQYWMSKVSYRSEVVYEGVLGFTTKRQRHLLSFDHMVNPTAFACVLVEYEKAGGTRAQAAREMRDFVGERERPVTWGYVFNGWMLAWGVLLVVSLGWVVRVRAWARERARQARVSAGGCGKCGYVRAGLAGGVCPECGEDNSRARDSKANMSDLRVGGRE